jgi:beta-glucuronidase
MMTMNAGWRFVVGLALMGMVWALPGGAAQRGAEVSLGGSWSFAMDPLGRGEKMGWHDAAAGWDRAAAQVDKGWDKVVVPHTWNVDPRYMYDGVVWYRRSFEVPAVGEDEVVRLYFGAVYYKCRVWVNGQLVGGHEGGYTPFELDITAAVKAGGWNAISVEVDNRWDETTLPGARPGKEPSKQLFPWWNYGGITHDVVMKVHKNTFVELTKIDSVVDLKAGTAKVRTTGWVRNSGKTARTVKPTVALVKEKGGKTVAEVMGEPITIEPGQVGQFKVELAVAAEDVELWSIGRPVLYEAVTGVTEVSGGGTIHQMREMIGLRNVEVVNGQLLLNGRPVRMGGANRVVDHPVYGACQPAELVKQDMELLKNGHMVLSRLQHQALDKAVLDMADRQGMLIIQEAANWGFPPEHMDNEVIREKFRQQTGEMIRSSWNHPSVIGYSVGNEYESWAPEGERWTRDMRQFVKSVDETRLVVFVSLAQTGGLAVGAVAKGDLERNRWSVDNSDIICLNIYDNAGAAGKWMDALHKIWPEKPIFITEYGQRADQVKDEAARIKYFKEFVAMMQSRPYVIGLAYWSFNDYRSRYPGSGANGYRPWGLVLPDRTPRGLYQEMVTGLSPAELLVEGGKVVVKAKSGFPSMDLIGVKVVVRKADGAVIWESEVPTVEMGSEWSVALPAAEGEQAGGEVVLLSATGHVLAREGR